MKTKKLLTMLLVVAMMFAMVGTLAGCDKKDGGKQVEAPGDDSGKKDVEKPQVTPTPEPTATPEPTPTPEVLPTAEELFAANKEMFDGNMKMIMKFAYKGQTEYGEMAMSVDAVQSIYENVTYQHNKAIVSMLGVSETMDTEVYYVDDKDASMRTEYNFDSENGVWTKAEYAYVELDEEEDSETSPLEEMENVEVTQDGEFYYLTGELNSAEVFDDTESLGMDGLEMGTTTCKMKFDKATKKVVSAEVVIKFIAPETEEGSMSVDDFVITVEELTEPIVIPEEVLNAELDDTDVDIDWEIEDEDDELNLPEPEKYDLSELPEGWGDWYDEYNCKSGTFLMYDKDTYEYIPITVNEKENWYFDNQYKYSLYLAADDPAICDYAPAYEVDYGDSGVSTADKEQAKEQLVKADFNEKATVADVVPIVCNEKQCFYLDVSMYDNVRSYIIFQDIGLDSYVRISIVTSDITTDPLEMIQMFLLNITPVEGEAI